MKEYSISSLITIWILFTYLKDKKNLFETIKKSKGSLKQKRVPGQRPTG